MLKEQLDVQLPKVESDILSLTNPDTLKDSLNEFFRFFHNTKASSGYLSLTPMNQLVSKSETVLSMLRDKAEVVSESIIEWLLKVTDQMFLYTYDIESKKTLLAPINEALLNKIHITQKSEKPINILKTLSLLYLDNNEKRVKKLLPILKTYIQSVHHKKERNKNNCELDITSIDIIILF